MLKSYVYLALKAINPTKRFFSIFVAVFTASVLSNSALAGSGATHSTGHIDVQNRTPIISLFHLARANYLEIEDQSYLLSTSAEASNYLSSTQKSNESLFIDGESYFYEQKIAYRHEDYIFGLSVPYISHTDGFLDRLIYDFHDILSLPQNGRTDFEHDRQFWRLTAEDDSLVIIDSKQQGIGDTTISVGRIINSSIQAFVTAKIPTGDFDNQTGSEEWDFGASLTQINPDWLKNRDWLTKQSFSFWWGGSINYLGEPDQLNALNSRKIVATGRLGFAWEALTNWSLKAQLDANSPVFDSEIRELGWVPIQISFSSAHIFSRGRYKLELMIAEDLRPRTTPDVVFGILFQTHI